MHLLFLLMLLKHSPTVDEWIELQRPSNPVISPDGRFVAYTVRRPNWTDNVYEQQLWLVDTGTSEQVQLTNSKGTNSDPAWSPDGRSLAFLSDRDGARQIYIVSPSGGEARRVTGVETGVSAFQWSPDGARIALTILDPETAEAKERRAKYGDFEVVGHDYRMTHLWVLSLSDGRLQRLTGGNDYTVNSFSWSPDGRRIAFDAQNIPRLSAEETNDIYVCSPDDGSIKRIVQQPGPDRDPHWSADGKEIVFDSAMGRANFFTENIFLAKVPAEGGTVTNLTPRFDERAQLVASAAGGLYFVAEQKAATHLFRRNADGTITRVTPEESGVYSSFTFTKDFSEVAFIEADATHCPEVYVSSTTAVHPRKLTDFNRQFADLRLGTREIVTWKNSQGITIEGALIKPPDFDPTRKYPLLVIIHGGPAAASTAALGVDPPYYPKEIWAARGALILEPNYRGSTGYGLAFHRLIIRSFGAPIQDDVESGIDSLIAKGWVDKARIGAMGWSFGGFITAWLATNSDRFAALSAGAATADWTLFDATTDLQEITRQYLQTTPWDDPELYRRSSPIARAPRRATPTMIQQGDLDTLVSPGEAYELYQLLTDHGVPARLYLYKGYGHSIRRPKGNRAVMEHNLRWFDHYLWGDGEAGLTTPPAQ